VKLFAQKLQAVLQMTFDLVRCQARRTGGDRWQASGGRKSGTCNLQPATCNL